MMKNLKANEYVPYQMNYIKLVSEQNIVKGLIDQKLEMIHFFSSIPVFKQEYRYQEGKWTIKDLLLHLIDAERVFVYRALRIVRNDSTPLQGFDENDYVLAAQANERAFENLLEEYEVVRDASISLFSTFSEADLLKLGTASKASVSVRGIGYCILGHELHHKHIIIERYL
jgi:uncharacterized damage-inducible protein DinB